MHEEVDHRELDPNRLKNGSQTCETGRKHIFVVPVERPGRLYFVLLSEFSERKYPDHEFTLEGPDLQISGRTDRNAEFRYEPVELGEYQLTVGDETYDIPAVRIDERPHPVNMRYITLPEEDDVWDEPSEEELDESPLDSVDEELAFSDGDPED